MATASKVTANSNGAGRVGRKRKDPDTRTYSGKIAARVRELREAKGWTVQDLADRIGVTDGAAYAYENGDATIPPDLYPKLAKVLGCKPPHSFFPPLR
jgi:ribosome-binding protein aMBF1 (putative translation factor)